MDKNKIYIVLAVLLGIAFGYFIFGHKNITPTDTEIISNTAIWTCAMHPEIKQSTKGDCPICGMDLTISKTMTDGLSADQFRMTQNALALANIQTSVVGISNSDTDDLKLSGTIEKNMDTQAVQVTHFTGRVEKLMIKSIGENIRKGQVIAMIYSPELVAAQQELLTALSLQKSQPGLYTAVRNKLRIKKVSNSLIDQIINTKKIKEIFPVHAQIDGIVSAKMVEEGDHIKTGQVLYEVVNLETVWATFDVYENQIALLTKGQSIQLTTNAYPTKHFDAVIDFIDPILNTTTRTTSARAVLKNKEAIFKPGMFIDGIVSIPNTSKNNTLSIPKSAVLWTGNQSVVYVKAKSDPPVFEMREVVLGNVIEDDYLITKGLKNGEEIVTHGTFTVDAAAQLSGKKSMMSTPKSVSHQNNEIVSKDHIPLSISFQENFQNILVHYFKLKDALVAGDEKEAALFSKKMNATFENSNPTKKSTKDLVTKSMKLLHQITSTDELATQREYFVTLNKYLVILSTNLQHISTTIYIQECPMANNNKGAVWLSTDKEIRNPYFGAAMLKCGSVTKILEAK